jgi:hypothetical protein
VSFSSKKKKAESAFASAFNPFNRGPSDHANYDGSQEREHETDGHKLQFTEHMSLQSLSGKSFPAF